jgi:hypothetical protein
MKSFVFYQITSVDSIRVEQLRSAVIRLPLASRRRPLQRQRQKAKPRASWALGKAGRRLLESKNLPKEGLDVILVR